MKIPSNKRISSSRQRKQQHLLDVKLRASTERSRRFRAICGFIFKTVFFVGLIAGSWFGGKEALRRFVWENPDYYLHDINFATDGSLTRDQVLTAANIVEGRNIFTVDLGHAREAIEHLPQVENAVVQRVLPNRINITIGERRPIAWVAAKGDEDPSASDKSFLIDARGVVLRSRVLLPEYYHLPIITGFETGNLVPGKRVNVIEMQSALELIRLNADSTRFQVRNIDISKGYCLIVTDQRHAKITFGLDRLDHQLERLYRCLDRATEDHKELQTVNLIVERNIPVTFYDPEADAAAAAAIAEGMPPKPGANSNAANEHHPAPKPSVETHHGDSTPRSSPKSSPKSSTPSRGSTGNQPLKKPFRLNP
ncbi:Polypeptide-transport-associated domain protein FtsQ-type [Chthoniobacter flavus Ellin428]|uniref:Polypeptide-transport-associated domain protein FtsQ-type n=1 Tax=Chthoniobacter flavus Ellin428 TaxID=497964 RepID=B4D1Z1_9BACT|nr:FtsQ-type POTRA domain-containing protein [Chthoniobacter flavus]EDY19753.1 Polypeptide-transport-associated domain protein FtsQ-type [Chthoniobacter flavus Ellin428]TCO92988.1 cell division septal protein FtsQ [Chthoniobacter flavus]